MDGVEYEINGVKQEDSANEVEKEVKRNSNKRTKKKTLMTL